MKFNYNLYIENKLNIEKFLLLEKYIIENVNNKNEILIYYDNNYNIKDKINTFYFIENENNIKNYDLKKYIKKCFKLINDIENKLNIECYIYLFDIDKNYNFYEMKLFINFNNDNELYNNYLKIDINNKYYKDKILIL